MSSKSLPQSGLPGGGLSRRQFVQLAASSALAAGAGLSPSVASGAPPLGLPDLPDLLDPQGQASGRTSC